MKPFDPRSLPLPADEVEAQIAVIAAQSGVRWKDRKDFESFYRELAAKVRAGAAKMEVTP